MNSTNKHSQIQSHGLSTRNHHDNVIFEISLQLIKTGIEIHDITC